MDWLYNARRLVSVTFAQFMRHKAQQLGAALSFYAAFSVVPLLMICGAVANIFFGTEAVEGQLQHDLSAFLGSDGATTVQSMLAANQKSRPSGVFASIYGSVALLIGAMGVFIELKGSMNTIWGVEVRPELGFIGALRDSLAAFVLVPIVALLLLVSMVSTTVLSVVGQTFPLSSYTQLVDMASTFALTTLLFALIFKYLPDVLVRWTDVWIGALVTALLFTIGKHLVGLYLAHTHMSTIYGAVSSILAFLLWTYYSSQIFFLGTEFTQVYSHVRGEGGQPTENARRIVHGDALPETHEEATHGAESDREIRSVPG